MGIFKGGLPPLNLGCGGRSRPAAAGAARASAGARAAADRVGGGVPRAGARGMFLTK